MITNGNEREPVCTAVRIGQRYDFDSGGDIYYVGLVDGLLHAFELFVGMDTAENLVIAKEIAGKVARTLGVPVYDATGKERVAE